jgi:radical SAM superfamily enzyme
MPLVIPVFIPHQGCPHTCVFCNQHGISGQTDTAPVTPGQVKDIIEQWLARSPGRIAEGAQVAFYGGSFTGLARSRQKELLDAVAPFFDAGRVREIRLSTRPDYVDAATVAFLREQGVTIVELGVQSMDQQVLDACGRGHTPGQTIEAVRLLRQGGMQVGIQLMIGLPGETTRSFLLTVKEAGRLRPDFVRIYPVLVLRGSKLAALLEQGGYRPLSLGKAVARAARMKKYFDAHGRQGGADGTAGRTGTGKMDRGRSLSSGLRRDGQCPPHAAPDPADFAGRPAGKPGDAVHFDKRPVGFPRDRIGKYQQAARPGSAGQIHAGDGCRTAAPYCSKTESMLIHVLKSLCLHYQSEPAVRRQASFPGCFGAGAP